MRILTICLLVLFMFSCESNLETIQDINTSERRFGDVGIDIDIDRAPVATHTKKIHYKVTIVAGTAANNWQSTYHQTSATGTSTVSCAKAKQAALNAMMSGAIITWEKACVH